MSAWKSSLISLAVCAWLLVRPVAGEVESQKSISLEDLIDGVTARSQTLTTSLYRFRETWHLANDPSFSPNRMRYLAVRSSGGQLRFRRLEQGRKETPTNETYEEAWDGKRMTS